MCFRKKRKNNCPRSHCIGRHTKGKRTNVTVGRNLIFPNYNFVHSNNWFTVYTSDGKRANVTVVRILFPVGPGNKVVPVLDQPEGLPMI